jgi:hypothetical protein
LNNWREGGKEEKEGEKEGGKKREINCPCWPDDPFKL